MTNPEKPQILAMLPSGHLHAAPAMCDTDTQHTFSQKKLAESFALSQSEGLMALAGAKNTTDWSAPLLFWREFAALYLTQLCHLPPSTSHKDIVISAPTQEELADFLLKLPPMPGAEYCSVEVLLAIWTDLAECIQAKISVSPTGVSEFFSKHLPLWHQVGRVCFHLAENKNDTNYPFAFMATYSPKLGKNAQVQYQPLNKALQEYAGERNKKVLMNLLEPIYKASKHAQWVHELLESNDIYHPLAWTPTEAYRLLESVPTLEESGVVVRLPDWWKARPRPTIQVSIGNTKNSTFGADALLDFKVDIALQGESLSEKELQELLDADQNLVSLRGQWVEVDQEKLQEALSHWQTVKRGANEDGLSFIEGMRLLAGANRDLKNVDELGDVNDRWVMVTAGKELKKILQGLHHPEMLRAQQPDTLLKATLRPYQKVGLNWLHFLTELGLGACLADDMGLGKTIQVIALLLIKKKLKKTGKPHLLVLPASLLSNWQAELARFAPSLQPLFLHASEMSRDDIEKISKDPLRYLENVDLVLTTYGMVLRQDWLQNVAWGLVILDEAQAIKNPTARQTKAVKSLNSNARIALTGTPIENRLGDLWSLFDFLCPGLLGSTTLFKNFIKTIEEQKHSQFAALRKLVQPYILRRLKTDKSIITDLPDKVEMVSWCGLSKEQAKLYAQAVKNLAKKLEHEDGIKRRGLVLAFLMKLKQICNHPSQFIGDGEFVASHSGKFTRLQELCEEIASRQEKVLVFTQFREMTEPLANFLETIFNASGLVLHGGTPVKKRKTLVEQFQREDGPPFFVLSLKAAGTGLNLTAANHVVHFDRWWNPAVENQATDRAFRIGQQRNVLVHKFVCRGTMEEKVDRMIAEKSQLADDVISAGGEALLTELDDNELMNLVSLDLQQTQI